MYFAEEKSNPISSKLAKKAWNFITIIVIVLIRLNFTIDKSPPLEKQQHWRQYVV
jgi:hypothetical protein